MATEVGAAYVSILPSAAGFGAALTSQLVGPSQAAAAAAGTSASASLSGSLLGGLRAIGPQMAGMLGFATIGIAAFKAAESVEGAMNTIIRATGATGEELDGLEQSFKNIANTSPAGFGVIASALAEVSQRTGLTGASLELLTKQVVTFNRITKDSPIEVQTLTQALAAFNVPAKDMSAQLDRLFNISQKTGVPLEQLTQTLVTAGPLARQFGLDVDFTAGFLAKLNKAGVDSTALIPGLKAVFRQFEDAGGTPKEALANLVGQIDALVKAGPEGVSAAQAFASSIFGARGIGLVDAAVSGKLSLQSLNEEIDTTGKGILGTAAETGTLAGKLGTLKNQATLAFAAFGTPVLEAATDTLTKLVPVTAQLGGVLAALAPALAPALVGWGAFILVNKTIVPLLNLAIGGVMRLGQAMLNAGASAGAASIQGLATFGNGLQRFASLAPGIAAAGVTAALSFNQIGESAAGSAIGVGSLVATGAMLGNVVMPGVGAAVGAAVGGLVGLGKAMFGAGESAEELKKKMSELAQEISEVGYRKAALAFFKDAVRASDGLSFSVDEATKRLQVLATTSPAAAQKVLQGLQSMRTEAGKPLFTGKELDGLVAAVAKGETAFQRHAANTAKASEYDQQFKQSLTDIGPAADAAKAAIDSFASTVGGQLPSTVSIINDVANAAAGIGAALDPATVQAKFAETIFTSAAFFTHLKEIFAAGYVEIAAVIAQSGPVTGGALASTLADGIRNGETDVVASLNEQAQTIKNQNQELVDWTTNTLGPALYGANAGAVGQAAAGVTSAAPQVGSAALAGGNAATGQWNAGLGGIAPGTKDAIKGAGPIVSTESAALASLYGFSGGAEIGKALVAGIVAGLQVGTDSAINAMRGLIVTLIAAAKKAAGIQSPSKVFAEMGSYMTKGMALGIEDGIPEVVKAAEHVVAAAALEGGRGVPTFLGGSHSVGSGVGPIQVNVHGVSDPRLARAAGEEAGRGVADALARRGVRIAAQVGGR